MDSINNNPISIGSEKSVRISIKKSVKVKLFLNRTKTIILKYLLQDFRWFATGLNLLLSTFILSYNFISLVFLTDKNLPRDIKIFSYRALLAF